MDASDPTAPGQPAAPQHATEKRRSQRHRMLKGALITYNKGHTTIPCTLRNVSETGARLRIGHEIPLPTHFELRLEIDAIAIDCAIVWRSLSETGVVFESEPRTIKTMRTQVIDTMKPPAQPTLRRRH